VEISSITPDPRALRALSHPVRLRLLGLLRTDGPSTASALAARLGLNSGATSYHLRQLAAHGFVVDDEDRGNGRERWWRAAHQSTRTSDEAVSDPGERDAHDAYLQAVAVVHTELLQRAVEERPLLPDPWRRTTDLSDWHRRLTPARAHELVEALHAVVERWEEDPAETRPGAGAGGPEGEAEDFVVCLQAFPRPGRVAPAAGSVASGPEARA
jgi:predicted ArsR family transcriptional regulator